jgi:hypothetical protein
LIALVLQLALQVLQRALLAQELKQQLDVAQM